MSILIPALIGAAVGVAAAEYRARHRGPRRNPADIGNRSPWAVHADGRTAALWAVWLPSNLGWQKTSEDILQSLGEYIEKRGLLRLELPYNSKNKPDFSWLFPQNQVALRKWIRSQRGNLRSYGPFVFRNFNVMEDPIPLLHSIVAALMELPAYDPQVDAELDSWLDQTLRTRWSDDDLDPAWMMNLVAMSSTSSEWREFVARVYNTLASNAGRGSECSYALDRMAYILRDKNTSNRDAFREIAARTGGLPRECRPAVNQAKFATALVFPLVMEHDELRVQFTSLLSSVAVDKKQWQKLIRGAAAPSVTRLRELVLPRENPDRRRSARVTAKRRSRR